MITNKVAIGSTLVPQTSGGILALSNAIYDPTGVTTVEQSLANSQTDLDKAKELIPKFNIKIVDSLPDTDVEEGSVYLISKTDGDINQYDEYLYVGKHYTFKVLTEFPTAMEYGGIYILGTTAYFCDKDTGIVTTYTDVLNYIDKTLPTETELNGDYSKKYLCTFVEGSFGTYFELMSPATVAKLEYFIGKTLIQVTSDND